MTSEQIIQRLLDENKISVKDAMVILKDLAKIALQQIMPNTWVAPDDTVPPQPFTVVMYGVQTPSTTYNESTVNSNVVTSDKED